MLFSEIIFLKSHLNNLESNIDPKLFKTALDKLEYLLNLLKRNDTDLSDKEFDKILKVIYLIFNDIVDNIN